MSRPRTQPRSEWSKGRLRAGDLIHRVTARRPADVRDTFGDSQPTWVDVATVYASIESLTGRELWSAQQVQADVTHRVKLRPGAVPGIGPAWSLTFLGRVFQVLYVIDPVQQQETLELLCMETV